ncbi:adenylate/guanylate cyclase domain-containing protein [Actinomycetes bacterium KLBMP 9797]
MRASGRDERRWVSVLFVDLEGFTSLAAGLDPEDVRPLQREYFARVTEVLRRWDGVVEKYIGDAVLAVFGAPRAGDHDAYAAVRAGLEIHESLAGLRRPDGGPVRARVGVATGEALVDLAAAWDGGQALVCGDVVNTAARLQTHAAPGTVVVTAATRRATESLIRYRPLPPVTAAGKPAPVEVWRAADVLPYRLDGSHDGPLVGRRTELSTAVRLVTGAVRAPAAGLIRVTGPAGIGKSRLVRAAAAQVGAPVRWWFAACPPGGGRYAVLADLVRRQAGVLPGDDAPAIRQRLAAWATGELAGEVETLVTLLHAPGDVREAALARLLRAAARRPLILVLEDLHLADDATIELVRRLPVAVVVTHRPDQRLTGLGTAVPLGPLGASAVRRLATGLGAAVPEGAPGGGVRRCAAGSGAALPLSPVGGAVPLGPLGARATRRLAGTRRLATLAGGNPGYAVAYASWSPVTDAPVPDAVRRAVATRLDEIDEDDRAVLKAAAVLGAAWPAAVAHLVGAEPVQVRAALHRLSARGMLIRRASSTLQGHIEYAFRVPAIQQVAYGRLTRVRRIEWHRRAADWFSMAGRPATERARHWLAAAELARRLRRDPTEYHRLAARALKQVTPPPRGPRQTVPTADRAITTPPPHSPASPLGRDPPHAALAVPLCPNPPRERRGLFGMVALSHGRVASPRADLSGSPVP